MSRGTLVIYLVFLVAAIFYFQAFEADDARPRRPDPRGFQAEAAPEGPPTQDSARPRPLPAPSPSDPTMAVTEGGACEPACSGSAFAINRHGYWLTAKHVVEDCNFVVLLTGARTAVPVERITPHPQADVSVLWTDLSTPPLKLRPGPLDQGQSGFSIGFPSGDPGDVHGRLLGRVKVRRHGGQDRAQPAVIWAEISRQPPHDKPLGGLSGGAVLDQDNRVVGVMIAASARRGRLTSAAPLSLRQTIKQAGLDPTLLSTDQRRAPAIDGRSYGGHGDRLRSQLTVAKIYCLSEDPWK